MTPKPPRVRLPAEWEPQSGVQLTWPHAGTDWAPLLEYCSEQGRSAAERAGAAHAALADAIGRVAEAERSRSGATVVGLTGGVFQNRLLVLFLSYFIMDYVVNMRSCLG